MTTRTSHLGGVLLAGAIVLGLRWASTLAVTMAPGDEAVVRVAFRARPERIEVCRDSTPEELASVPAHMRQARVCVGGPATYRLHVRLDENVIADEIVHGGGLRGDRPIYVLRETLVAPGERLIVVRFTRQEAGPPAPASAVPDSLVLEHRVRLAPRGVALVTYDEETRTMEVR